MLLGMLFSDFSLIGLLWRAFSFKHYEPNWIRQTFLSPKRRHSSDVSFSFNDLSVHGWWIIPKANWNCPQNRCLVRKWCSKMDVRKDWNARFLISPWKTSDNALNIQKKANFQGFWWWGMWWGISILIPLLRSHPFSMTLIVDESEFHPLRIFTNNCCRKTLSRSQENLEHFYHLKKMLLLNHCTYLLDRHDSLSLLPLIYKH